MDINRWGPSLWNFLHASSFNYPHHPTTYDKKTAYIFINSVTVAIPCTECREHMQRSLKDAKTGILSWHSEHLRNRTSYSKWLHRLHNSVNLKLNKMEYSYSDLANQYKANGRACGEKECLINNPIPFYYEKSSLAFLDDEEEKVLIGQF